MELPHPINIILWLHPWGYDATIGIINKIIITRSAAVRRARTRFGKRAFSVCGPVVWNSLRTALRNNDSYPVFRRALKSHLFSLAVLFPHKLTVIAYIHW